MKNIKQARNFFIANLIFLLFPPCRFLPLYLKYCKVFDYDCSLESGCGFDDSCGFEENCVRDRNAKKGHTCQVRWQERDQQIAK